MQVIKLNDDIYSTFIIYTASEWKKEVYKSHDIYDKTIRVNLITGKRGTTLIFENCTTARQQRKPKTYNYIFARCARNISQHMKIFTMK